MNEHRSREQMRLGLLQRLANGPEIKTRIMRSANLTGYAGYEILDNLLSEGLIQRFYRKLSGVKGAIELYELTYEGREMIDR